MGKVTKVKDLSKEPINYTAGKEPMGTFLLKNKSRLALMVLGLVIIIGALYYWRANPSGPLISEQLQKSHTYYRQGNDEAAKNILLKIIDSDEASADEKRQAKLLLANVYANTGDQANAIKLREELVDDKTNYQKLLALGELYEEQGNKTKAREYYQKAATALSKEPDFRAKQIYANSIQNKLKALEGN